MKIIVSGPAIVRKIDGGEPISDAPSLQRLDGMEESLSIVDNLEEPIDDLDLEGGMLRLEYDSGVGALRAVTTYVSARKLTQEQLAVLRQQTLDQWSDGVGEDGFSGQCLELGISIDVGADGDAVRIEQIDDGARARVRSPLLAAAKSGDLAKIRVLVEKGEGLEAVGKWGHTPLLVAISNDHPEAALYLVQRGANVNHRAKEGSTAMEHAAIRGELALMRALLDAGGDIEARGDDGMTPLLWAANRGHLDLLGFLVDRGADVNARSATGQGALSYASQSRPDIREFLAGHGARP